MASEQETGGGILTMPLRQRGPLAKLWARVGVAMACLIITTLVVWFGRAGYRDLDGKLNDFLSCLYYATVSLSTTGYGDITPVTPFARMMNVLVITPLRFVFLITLVGTTVEVLTSRGRDEYRRHRWRNRVRDHTVIVGFGVQGRTAATTLVESGVPASSIVAVAIDELSCEDARQLNLVTVRGDARREDVLRSAAVDSAKSLIIATGSDDLTVLITLTARRLNPHLTITASARESANAELIRQSGANSVIMTAESAGKMLAITLSAPDAGEVLEDLIDPGRGLEVVQRGVLPAELGLSPIKLTEQGNLVLEIIRGATKLRFDSPDIGLLQRDDVLVLVRHRQEGSP